MEYNNMNQEFANQTDEQKTEDLFQSQPTKELPNEKVGFWEFFGLMLLFAIPVIGFISCIVFMFSPKRKSMKNYARAVFTWMVVRFVTAVLVIVLIINALGNFILPTINAELNTEFSSVSEIFGVAGDLMSGNYASVIDTLRPQLEEALGEQYKPLLEELSKEQYNEMFAKIAKEDYRDLLGDIKNGKYQELSEAIGEEEFASLTKELEAAANGEHSELFDNIEEIFSMF